MNKINILFVSFLISTSVYASSGVTLDDAIRALELAIGDIKGQRSEIEHLKKQVADMNRTVQINNIDSVKKQIVAIEIKQKHIEKQNSEIKMLLETRPKRTPFSVENISEIDDTDRADKSKGVFYKTTDGLRIREEADVKSRTIGLIEQGKPVEVTEIKNSYGFIGKGWVQMNYLQKVGN